MPFLNTVVNQSHALLELPDKGRVIKFPINNAFYSKYLVLRYTKIKPNGVSSPLEYNRE